MYQLVRCMLKTCAALIGMLSLVIHTASAESCNFGDGLDQVFCLENSGRRLSARKIFDNLNIDKELHRVWESGAASFSSVGRGEEFCRSVKKLEWLRAKKIKTSEKYLDYLYLGNWRGIAALEGNKQALYETGEYYLERAEQAAHGEKSIKRQSYVDAYRFFLTASIQKSARATLSLPLVEARLSQAQFPLADIKPLRLKKILCPVRKN